MKCSKCGAEFQGKFCPECGTPAEAQTQQSSAPVQPSAPVTPSNTPQQAKKKGGCLKGGLIVVLALIAIIIIFSIANGGNKSTPTAVTTTSSGSAASSAIASSQESASSQQTVFGVNQPVKNDSVELTVTKVQRSNGSEYDKPKSGMEFVIVTVKYKNVGKSDTLAYNPYDFKMKNSKGQITDETFTTVNQDTALNSGNLAPGGEIEGSIAFAQPKGDKGLILQYTGNIFKTDSQIDFKLG